MSDLTQTSDGYVFDNFVSPQNLDGGKKTSKTGETYIHAFSTRA